MTIIYKIDESTVWHFLSYWLLVFIIAFVSHHKFSTTSSLILGIIGSLIFWFMKEYFLDVLYRKQPFNVYDVFAGFLIKPVIEMMWSTQFGNR